MIIGISGRIGSGKNTVAAIINQLTNNMFVEKSFASKLKECAAIITGIPRKDMESIDIKNGLISEDWGELTVRKFLQLFGTEVGRSINPNIWVNALFNEYDVKPPSHISSIPLLPPVHIGDVLSKYKKTKFRCGCGNTFTSTLWAVENGHTKSCGCLQPVAAGNYSRTHGDSYKRLYSIYKNMKTRCYNEHSPSYEKYGDKGITICNEWLLSYSNFKQWALTNGYNDDLTIDRVDNNGNYEPDNCRWILFEDQSLNKLVYRSNKLGVRGVSISPNNRYVAQIQYKGKKIFLGYFDTVEEASTAYEAKREELFVVKGHNKNWVITDVRFSGEVDAIKSRGGIMIRLTRNSDVISEHTSETALDHYAWFDYGITNNNTTIDELIQIVKNILIIEHIITKD